MFRKSHIPIKRIRSQQNWNVYLFCFLWLKYFASSTSAIAILLKILLARLCPVHPCNIVRSSIQFCPSGTITRWQLVIEHIQPGIGELCLENTRSYLGELSLCDCYRVEFFNFMYGNFNAQEEHKVWTVAQLTNSGVLPTKEKKHTTKRNWRNEFVQ